MLSQLHIENVAVIEQADLDLMAGLNILTGETGAGKSILIDAINLVLGERISKDIVRNGAASAHVTALFTDISQQVKEKLLELGLECEEDGSLLISRNISADGKGSCRIAGRPVTVGMMREVGRILVNIHGQHDNQALMQPDKHVVYLDRYANLSDRLEEYRQHYGQMKQLMRELASIETDAAAKARRIDLLNYQIEEIELADPQKGEDEELAAQRLVIQNSAKITEAVGGAYDSLFGGDGSAGAQEIVAAAASQLEEIREVYPEIASLTDRISSLAYELDDCVTELRGYTDKAEYNSGDIDYIEQRLDTLYRLKLKYGGSIDEVLSYLQMAREELEAIEMSDETAKKLTTQIQIHRDKAQKLAMEITLKRLEAASSIEHKIVDELTYLEMAGANFKVALKPLPELSSAGADEVEFLISANPGSPLKPLAKIASGGEISRIMLGIKTVLAGNDDIDTLIFDEIDTGVSGRAAQKIGMKLKEVSASRQVICVTHLAQIAAQADRHILIEKKVSENKTFTQLQVLAYPGRKQELARIIGGAGITDITLQNAAEMLKNAGIEA